MAPGVLDELTAALTEFEQTFEATWAARRQHIGASAELESLDAEVAEQVRLLDGVVKYRFGDNAEPRPRFQERTKARPANTPPIDNITEPRMNARQPSSWPRSQRSAASSENAEKVVNPPRMPGVRNS